MSRKKRVAFLLLSLLLPVLLTLASRAFIGATVGLEAQDRAIVWVEADAAAASRLHDLLREEAMFPRGRLRQASATLPAHARCRPDAWEASFAGLRTEENQPARRLIERLAAEAGARVCASQLFRLNEVPSAEDESVGAFTTSRWLLMVMLPGGFCLCLYWMFAPQLGLRLRGPPSVSVSHAVGIAGAGAAAALLLVIVASLAFATAPMMPGAAPDAGTLWLAMLLVGSSPVFTELAFRAWLLPLAERALGLRGAVTWSMLVFALAQFPRDATSLFEAVIVGGVFSLVYVRTRSWPATAFAHALFALAAMGWQLRAAWL